MRGEEGEKQGGGGMVMMCLHMICWMDITNHLVPMVTPLGCAHTRTHTFTETDLFSHSLINISLFTFHFFFLSKTMRIFKRLLVWVCGACGLVVCLLECVHVKFSFSRAAGFCVHKFGLVCVKRQEALSSALSPVNAE